MKSYFKAKQTAKLSKKEIKSNEKKISVHNNSSLVRRVWI